MSKRVKDLLTKELYRRFEGVEDCLVANVIGLDANATVALRRRLREKEIHVMVVKNSLARRATEGTPLAAAFAGIDGPAAIVWGEEDFVSLTKQIIELEKSDEFEAFHARGGVLDGEQLSADKVKEISKWPNRPELISIVAGQVIGVGSQLAGQLIAPAQQIVSQIDKLIEQKENES